MNELRYDVCVTTINGDKVMAEMLDDRNEAFEVKENLEKLGHEVLIYVYEGDDGEDVIDIIS